ncbi:MAG TPA: hypothetical protein VJ951_00750 [Bacteroidales bacterium]|nr:hypothetical protein [Bacteroidales bacterium]
MARIIGQIESSKSLRAELTRRNIHRFSSVGEINKFLREYPSEEQKIVHEQEILHYKDLKEKSTH